MAVLQEVHTNESSNDSESASDVSTVQEVAPRSFDEENGRSSGVDNSRQKIPPSPRDFWGKSMCFIILLGLLCGLVIVAFWNRVRTGTAFKTSSDESLLQESEKEKFSFVLPQVAPENSSSDIIDAQQTPKTGQLLVEELIKAALLLDKIDNFTSISLRNESGPGHQSTFSPSQSSESGESFLETVSSATPTAGNFLFGGAATLAFPQFLMNFHDDHNINMTHDLMLTSNSSELQWSGASSHLENALTFENAGADPSTEFLDLAKAPLDPAPKRLGAEEAARRDRAALKGAALARKMITSDRRKKGGSTSSFRWVTTNPNDEEHVAAHNLWKEEIGADASLLVAKSFFLVPVEWGAPELLAYDAQFKKWQEELKDGEELTVIVEDHVRIVEYWVRLLTGRPRHFQKYYPHLANPRGLRVVFLTCHGGDIVTQVPRYKNGQYFYPDDFSSFRKSVVDESELETRPTYSIFANQGRVGGESLDFSSPLQNDHVIAADIMRMLLPHSRGLKDLAPVVRKTLSNLEVAVSESASIQKDYEGDIEGFVEFVDAQASALREQQQKIVKLYREFAEEKWGCAQEDMDDFLGESSGEIGPAMLKKLARKCQDLPSDTDPSR